jgi:hypothetical protein
MLHTICTNKEYQQLRTIAYSLTPWCRVLLEQLTGLQLVKKFHVFHGTRRFITALIYCEVKILRAYRLILRP